VSRIPHAYMVKHFNTRPSFRRQKEVEAIRITTHQWPFKVVRESRFQRQKGLSREQDVDSCWPINGPSMKGAVQRNIVKVTGKVNSRIYAAEFVVQIPMWRIVLYVETCSGH